MGVSSINEIEYMETFAKYLLGYFLVRSLLFNLVGLIRSLLVITWDKVPAHITYTNIDASVAVKGVRNYDVDIWFYYYYKDKMYNSKQFAFNYSNNPLLSLHKFTLWRLKRKKQVFARVNPKDPNNAVIFTGINLFHIMNLCLPILSGPSKLVELELIKKISNKVK
jgi:hypothetical protein